MFIRQWAFVISCAIYMTGCGRDTVYFTPGTGCEDQIIAELGRAKNIDIAVYAITNPKIASAIIGAHHRGARIRIVTDRTMAGHKSSMIDELVAAGIPVRTNRRHKIEHNKFAVFDNRRIVTGSYNWTTTATKYNSENCIFLDQDAQKYAQRFEVLWGMYK